MNYFMRNSLGAALLVALIGIVCLLGATFLFEAIAPSDPFKELYL